MRCKPSSGNLHPTEGYAIEIPLWNSGVYHYVSRDHCWKRLAAPDGRAVIIADLYPN